MPTTINTATISASDPRLPSVSGVQPATSNDGRYTWSVIEESSDGSQLVLRATGPGRISSYNINGNSITTTMATAVAGTASYLTLRVTYSGTGNGDNWAVYAAASGQTSQRFQKGNGGGSARRTGTRSTKVAAA